MQSRSQQAVTKVDGSQKKYLRKQEPWKPEDQASLALVLGQVFDMQKQFGKNTGQLENIVKGFCWALRPYPVEAVIDAIATYCRLHADMPTPSDIVKIIDPPAPVWKPDKAYYITLKDIYREQGPYGLDTEEIEYVRRYEEHMKREERAAR